MDTRLIIRYLEGHLEREREKELFEWLHASEHNMSLFRELEEEWKAKHIPSVESLAMLHNLRKAMERDMPQRRRISSRLWWISAAAAVAVVAGLFAFDFAGLSGRDEEDKQIFAVEAPMGAHSKISLPDGTQVWLNAGSVLSYDSDFNRNTRNINLNGEAYFEVKHDAEKPFCVNVDGCSFTVLGTKFNINAYEADSMVQTVLIEGSLRFDSGMSHDVMLPGEMISWNPSEKVCHKEKVNASQYRSWINGVILYDSITLPALLKRLSREYNISISLETDKFNDKSFRVSYTNGESVDSILSALCQILPIEVSGKDGRYYVYGR